jgi:hypothetical protein
MARRFRSSTILRALFPLLVSLLVLGHACEVFAAVPPSMASHGTDDHHHVPDGGADRSEAACDPIDGLPRTGPVELTAGDAAAVVGPVDALLPVRLVASSLDPSETPSARPPLFLLHASLRI